jgi:DNA polymerase III alpha subunit
VKSGAFDFTGELRAVMFTKLEQVLASAASMQKDKKAGQGGLFDDFDLAKPKSKKNEPRRPPSSGPRMKFSPLKKNSSASTSAATRSTATAAISTR